MMEFSPEILTEFGLNMAGYIVVGILVYVLTRSRRRRVARVIDTRVEETPPPARREAPPRVHVAPEQPQFMSLFSESASAKPVVPVATVAAPREEAPIEFTPATRRENRRAIYREARRLMATGKSERELLDRLPLTEDELEMLSVAGRA